MTRRLKNKSGFALVLTLIITALMVAVVTEMIHQVYVDVSLSRSFRDGQQASIMAASGVEGAARLLNQKVGSATVAYTSLTDMWAVPIKLDDEAGSLEITVSEESGKINVNDLVQPNGEYLEFTRGVLERLSTRMKLPLDMWAAVADWIDTDDIQRSGGAESVYYRALQPPYSARNGKLVTLTELSLVKGITPEILGKLRPCLTVFSEQDSSMVQTRININTAPKDVLAVLDKGIDDRMAAQIVAERTIQPFKSVSELANRVPGMDTVATALISKATVKGTVFRITSVAKVKDSGRTVEAVVRLGTRGYLSWQEY